LTTGYYDEILGGKFYYVENVSDKQLIDFHLSCRNLLKAVVAKLLNKTTVQYPLANNLAFLDLDLYPTQTRDV